MTRIYDLPTRIFHWLFATSFIVAFSIANLVDDELAIFAYHMIAGATLGLCIVWRFIWGFIGTKHACFSDYVLKPKALICYFKDSFTKHKKLWNGHNPASSWAAILMMLLAFFLIVSGILMTTGPFNEAIEELHEFAANAFMLVVVLHILGVLVHTVKQQDPIAKSMISGYKNNIPSGVESVKLHAYLGAMCLIITLTFTGVLVINFDQNQKTTSLFGVKWHLQEFENEHDQHHENNIHQNEHE
ncbi:cytochrome b/b6 domain-containing protein [Pseudoalteromonas sp. MMG024]|uniref:cytochrome b/b6 domain-containing protein n=1 Tax=Pseudoalteromonas sp. MMG024 TaxID=2909980 RepID=UPI001F25A041|nr:cytochrome b/b6 domain-containing protein [Pseudoalteromonas sp. MMG024]MCF6457443.1 cytochrome b/b6 domain-containing protein [Pseudoalteromonas sp. MMG024]